MSVTRRKNEPWVYALYYDEEFIDIGTADELAEITGLSRKYIISINSKHYKERSKGRKYVLVRLEED